MLGLLLLNCPQLSTPLSDGLRCRGLFYPSSCSVFRVILLQWPMGMGYRVFEGSVQFSHSVISDSLLHHGLQHARLPCPSPTPGACSNSCPSSQWCHPTSSVVPFSSCPQSFPASGSFQMSQFFTSGGQTIGVSASTLVLPKNTQDWSPFGWTGWISLQSKGLSEVLSNTTVQKHEFFSTQLSLYSPTLTSINEHSKSAIW